MVQKAVMYNENIHKFPSYIFKSIFKVKMYDGSLCGNLDIIILHF